MRYLCVLPLLFLFSALVERKEPITIYLAGDSTMAEKLPDKRPETGWGEALQKFFPANKVRIENHAQNGRSSKSFIAEGRWQMIVDKLKVGDYVLIHPGTTMNQRTRAIAIQPHWSFAKI